MKTQKRWLFIKILSIVMAFSLSVFFVSCKSNSGKPKVEELVNNTQITINQTTKNMLVGDTDILTVDYTGKKDAKIEWSSDNQSVVTVTDGSIEAVGEGTANVTASCGKATATCTINVTYGNTLPELINGYGFEEKYTIYKNDSLHFTPAILFRGRTYTDATFEIISSNPDVVEVLGNEVVAKSQIGQAVITITASWRKFNATNTLTLCKNFTVSVAKSSYIALENGATNEIELFTLAEFEGQSYKNSVDFVPVVYVDGQKVNGANVSVTVENHDVATVDSGKLVGKQYGDTTVLLSYENGDETYQKTLSVHVNRPIAQFGDTVNYFSAFTGTYKDKTDDFNDKKLATVFGEGVTLYDAYFGEEQLTVTADGRVLGLKSDKNGVIESEITVGNLIWQYKVKLEVYGAYICQAEDLKVFQAVSTGLDNDNKSTGTKTLEGYCVLGKDIYADNLELSHESFTGNKPYPNLTTDGGFVGTFDGNGHTIYNLKAPNTGLFFQLKNTTLKNVAFVNATVDGYYKTLLAHRIFDCTLENVYINMAKMQNGGSILCSDQIKNTSLNNIVIENPMSKSDVQSGNNYSIAGLAARNHFELKGDWTNVYTITPLAFEMSYREMFTPNEGQDKTGQGTWAYFDYLAVAENVTEQQIADYWTWGVYSEEHINAETITITGVKSFASRASMALSQNDLTSFNNNDCWVVENGIPVWKNLLEDYRLTEKDFLLKTSADGNAFTDNISFEFTDTFGNSLPLETKISLVNSADSVCVDVADNQLSKNPDYLALTDKKISVKVTASVGDIEIEKIVEVTLRQNTDSLKQETISGLYIEADGTIKGLNAQQLAKLQDAIYRSAVDGVDINYENGKLSTEFLSEVELGSESSILAISKDTVYTLNYRCVTKAIGDAEDLRVFTVKPAEVAEGETKHATEVSGYYVLTKNIDASQLVLDAHSGYKATYYPSPNEDKGFTGTLDGQGYTISNLTVKGEGLFSVVYGATIKNIGFVNGKVEAGSGYTAFFAHKMILCELSNVYVHVVSLNGTKTTQSILTNSTMHKVKMTNVVIDYDQTAFDSGEYYSALGLIDGKSTTNQGSWKNVYTISATPLALDDGHIMVASNQSEEKINALKDKFLSGQTVNVLKVDGVKSYDSIEDLQKAKEDLSGFTDSYWDISNGAPVWKTA